MSRSLIRTLCLIVSACGGSHTVAEPDAAMADVPLDIPVVFDASRPDARVGGEDAGPAEPDAGDPDAGVIEIDAGTPMPDAGPDAGGVTTGLIWMSIGSRILFLDLPTRSYVETPELRFADGSDCFVSDIAVSSMGEIVAMTPTEVVAIDGRSGVCTRLAGPRGIHGTTYVAAGEIAVDEALVYASPLGSALLVAQIRPDDTNENVLQAPLCGDVDMDVGDIVSIGDEAYVSYNCGEATGRLGKIEWGTREVSEVGPTPGTYLMDGLAFDGESLIGFTRDGMYRIDTSTGEPTLLDAASARGASSRPGAP